MSVDLGVVLGSRIGSRYFGIYAGTVSVNPPNQVAAAFFTFTVALVGARVGDVIKLTPPDTLENTLRLVGARVTATDVITIKMEATAAVDGAALLWGFILFDTTAGGIP